MIKKYAMLAYQMFSYTQLQVVFVLFRYFLKYRVANSFRRLLGQGYALTYSATGKIEKPFAARGGELVCLVRLVYLVFGWTNEREKTDPRTS